MAISMEVIRLSGATKTFWYRFTHKKNEVIVKSVLLEVDLDGNPVIGKIAVFNKLYLTEEDAKNDVNGLDFAIKVTFN
jgi:hypothetical protein